MFCYIALIITMFVAVAHASCSENYQEHCMTPITDFRNKLGISNELTSSLHRLNDEQLDDYCKYGRQAAVCLNGVNHCNEIVSKFFEGFLDSIDFLCRKTLDEYKSHQQCYATNSVHSGLESCDSYASIFYHPSTKSISGEKLIHTNNTEKLCSWLHLSANGDYLCIRHVVEPVCGKAAAEWQVNYIKKAFRPMISFVHCNALQTWVIVVISVVLFVIISAVLGVISVVLFVIISAVLGKVIYDRTCCKDNPSTPQFNNILSNPAATEAYPQSSDSVKFYNMN